MLKSGIMPARRNATSPEEMAQVVRVHKLLADLHALVCVYLDVTTANFEKLRGELRCVEIRVTQNMKGRPSSHGLLTLAIGESEVKINFLDVVFVDASNQDVPARRAR
jgi:hypothetical protein